MSSKIQTNDGKENLPYNYCILETVAENITDDYFNAIVPIFTSSISKGFDEIEDQNPQNRKFVQKDRFITILFESKDRLVRS